MRAVRAIVMLAGVVAGLACVFFISGGYIWRVDCLTAEGTVRRSWEWNSFIPWVGPSETGCEAYAAPRIALSALGVWKIDDVGGSPYAGAADPEVGADRYTLALLATGARLERLGQERAPEGATRDEVLQQMEQALQSMKDEREALQSLVPPEVVASKHADMVGAYDQAVTKTAETLQALRDDETNLALILLEDSQKAYERFGTLAGEIVEELQSG